MHDGSTLPAKGASAMRIGNRSDAEQLVRGVLSTMAELEAKGATFSEPVTDQGYGLVTTMDVPGADPIQIYQPKHQIAYKL